MGKHSTTELPCLSFSTTYNIYLASLSTPHPVTLYCCCSAELLESYAEYLDSDYYVPPCSVYEYESYPYEYDPIPKSYPFMGDDEEAGPPSPRNVQYFTIVQSIGPDIDRLRARSRQEMR